MYPWNVPSTIYAIVITGIWSSLQASMNDLSKNEGTVLVTGSRMVIHSEMSTPPLTVIASVKAAQHRSVHGVSSDLKAKNIKKYEIIIAGMGKDDDGKHATKKVAQVHYDAYNAFKWFFRESLHCIIN